MTTNGLPGLPLPSNRTALIVDDTDSNVVYTPPEAWFFQISSNRQYNSSRTGTNSTGAQAQFEFEGTQRLDTDYYHSILILLMFGLAS